MSRILPFYIAWCEAHRHLVWARRQLRNLYWWWNSLYFNDSKTSYICGVSKQFGSLGCTLALAPHATVSSAVRAILTAFGAWTAKITQHFPPPDTDTDWVGELCYWWTSKEGFQVWWTLLGSGQGTAAAPNDSHLSLVTISYALCFSHWT